MTSKCILTCRYESASVNLTFSVFLHKSKVGNIWRRYMVYWVFFCTSQNVSEEAFRRLINLVDVYRMCLDLYPFSASKNYKKSFLRWTHCIVSSQMKANLMISSNYDFFEHKTVWRFISWSFYNRRCFCYFSGCYTVFQGFLLLQTFCCSLLAASSLECIAITYHH